MLSLMGRILAVDGVLVVAPLGKHQGLINTKYL